MTDDLQHPYRFAVRPALMPHHSTKPSNELSMNGAPPKFRADGWNFDERGMVVSVWYEANIDQGGRLVAAIDPKLGGKIRHDILAGIEVRIEVVDGRVTSATGRRRPEPFQPESLERAVTSLSAALHP